MNHDGDQTREDEQSPAPSTLSGKTQQNRKGQSVGGLMPQSEDPTAAEQPTHDLDPDSDPSKMVDPGFSGDGTPIEPHDPRFDVVSGIRMGHAKVPMFLRVTIVAIVIWGFYYSFSARQFDDRIQAGTSVAPTAAAGEQVFNQSCAGCHNPTAERKIGPGLKGVKARLGDAGIETVLHNGRPGKGMPNPAAQLGLTEQQIQAVKLYLESLT